MSGDDVVRASAGKAEPVSYPVMFDGKWHETHFHQRHSMDHSRPLHGPLVVEEESCTTVVAPGYSLRFDMLGNMIVERRHAIMSKHSVDPVSTEVIRNAFNAIAEDMGAILNRSAYSPVIYECHDYGAALFNEKAETLGQAPGLPLFTGGLDAGIVATIEKYGAGGIADGDVFIVNDSYITGGHLNDVDIIGAIGYQNQLVGFACIRAHWSDVGMADPGFPVNTTQIYQEGLRLPPMRIMVDGQWVQDVLDVICLNSRLPKVLRGDLNAQVAAAKMGAQRMKALLGRFGLPTVRAATDRIFAATEAKFREFISHIPDGVYEAHGTSDY